MINFEAIIKDILDRKDIVNKMTDLDFENLLKEPEKFYKLFPNQTQLMTERFFEIKGSKKYKELGYLFNNYKMVVKHVEFAIIKREGKHYSTTKSKWIVSSYFNHLKTNEKINMEHDYDVHKPRFGTSEQWINYIESIFDLSDGDPTAYFKNLNDMMGG